MSLSEKLAKNMRYKRSEIGWTQEEAAEACDLSDRAYREIESGHGNPKLATLEQISKGLGIAPGDLFK